MKTNSIDALRQRAVETEGKIALVLADCQGIHDKAVAENRDITKEEQATFDTGRGKVVSLNAVLKDQNFMIAEAAAQLEREKGIAGVIVGDGKKEAAKANTNGFKCFGEQLQAVARGARTGRPDPKLLFGDLDGDGKFRAAGGSDGAMNEAVPSEGGFLVGADTNQQIYQRTYATGAIKSRCSHQTIGNNANRLKLRVVDEDSRADGSRMGGVLSYWENEADTAIASKAKFRAMELVLNKILALVPVTNELLEDAAALEDWIMTNLPTELNFRIEDALINGTGVGQPLGVLNAQATLQIAKYSTDSGAVFTSNDVLNMWARFWQPGLLNSIASIGTENLTVGNAGQTPGSAWFIDQTVIPQLFGMTLGTGTAVILLYHPPGYNGLQGPYGQLLGLPVIPTEHQQVLGTPGDVILADMSQYLLADKGGIKIASSMHVNFKQDEMMFRFTDRVDAQPTWKKPLTPKNGGSTLAPFVTVATRS